MAYLKIYVATFLYGPGWSLLPKLIKWQALVAKKPLHNLAIIVKDWLLPTFIPRRGLALPDFPGLFKKSSFKMADSQRIVRIKTRTKAFFFEEILINIPSENLPKLGRERMQYFWHALKLNLRSRHSAASASNCSMNRSLEPKMTINFRQQRILCLILPASVKERITAGKNTDVIVYIPIVT